MKIKIKGKIKMRVRMEGGRMKALLQFFLVTKAADINGVT